MSSPFAYSPPRNRRPLSPVRSSPGSCFQTIPDPQDIKSIPLRAEDLLMYYGQPEIPASSHGSPAGARLFHRTNPTKSSDSMAEKIVKIQVPEMEAKPWTNGAEGGEDESAQNRVLVKGGKIVNDDCTQDADVYIEDGIIKQVGRDLIVPGGTRTLDAKGKYVIPGGIDSNTYFQFNFMGAQTADDFYSGTKAALAGGTTMIINFAYDSSNSPLEAYEKYRSMADEKVCCDYGLHIILSDWNDQIMQEMETLVTEKGVNSFKIYMAYKDFLMLSDGGILQIMEVCKRLGGITLVHAENGDVVYMNEKKITNSGKYSPEEIVNCRPEEIEAEAALRASVLGNQAGCPVFIMPIMSKSAADIICQKRKEGCLVYGGTSAAALATDGSHVFNKCWRHAAGHVTHPPLSPDPATKTYLMDLFTGTGNGDVNENDISGDLQIVASDHCTYNAAQKELGANDFTKIPPGVNGVEDRMSIVWEMGVVNGKIDPCQFVAITSTNAAKLFNIYPRKGRIQVGSDADIVIWDPKAAKTISAKSHQQAGDFNIFEGIQCHGVPQAVIANGRVILDDGELRVSQGVGRYVPMPPFASHIYSCLENREKKGKQGEVRPQKNGVGNLNLMSPIIAAESPTIKESPISAQSNAAFHNRPPTRGGTRNLQDSSFSISGAQIDDHLGVRSGIRVKNPPGGRSSGLW